MEAVRTKNISAHFEVPMIDSADNNSFKTGETVTDTAFYKDGAGAWTSLPITDTFAEIGSTGMYEITLTAAEMNHDQIIIKMTSAGASDNAIAISTIPAPGNLKQIAQNSIEGGSYGATLQLGQLDIQSQTATEPAIKAIGNTSGAGLYAEGGNIGNGVDAFGGSTSGVGVNIDAQTSGDGLVINGRGGNSNGISSSGVAFGSGAQFNGGSDGPGVKAFGGSTAGHGIEAIAQASGNGFKATGGGSGAGIEAVGAQTGAGILAIGGPNDANGIEALADAGTAVATGHGFRAIGKASEGLPSGIWAESLGNGTTEGYGIYAEGFGISSGIYGKSGNGATGDGIKGESDATNGHGINGEGAGTGDGIRAKAGANGNGFHGIGGTSSGPGAKFEANTAGHGIHAFGAGGSGYGIYSFSNDSIGMRVQSGGGNGDGMKIEGIGTGHGLYSVSGALGDGIRSSGGITSGQGIKAEALGTGNGIYAVGGGIGDGLAAESGAGATGSGARFEAKSTNGDGIETIKTGTGIDLHASDHGDGSWETGTAISQQDVRDAMKLAPSIGAPAAGSVDEHLDDILTDTGTTLPATLTTIEGKVDTVDTVVDAILLDTADMQPKLGVITNLGSGATIGDNLSDMAGATFSSATDSLEAIRDRGDAAWITGTAISQQDVRDAMKLAPTVGAPAAGSVDEHLDDILTDTGTTLPATLTTIESKIDTVDTVVDAILVDTGTTIPATLTTIEGKIDVVDSVVDAILVDTADMQPKLGAIPNLGSGATLGDNNSDMAGGTFASGTDSLEAIRDRGDAAWTGDVATLLLSTTINGAPTSNVEFVLTDGSPDDDAYNGCVVVVTDASTANQKAVGTVLDYVAGTKTLKLLRDESIFTFANGDTVEILAANELVLQQTLEGTPQGEVNAVPGSATVIAIKNITNTDADLTVADVLKNRTLTFRSGNCQGQQVAIQAQAAIAAGVVTLTVTDIAGFAGVAIDDRVEII